jgi:hypothetical protein
MKNNGVNSPLARENYISWLRYVASNFSAVNSMPINQQKINEIFDWLTETTDSRMFTWIIIDFISEWCWFLIILNVI